MHLLGLFNTAPLELPKLRQELQCFPKWGSLAVAYGAQHWSEDGVKLTTNPVEPLAWTCIESQRREGEQ